MKTCPKCEKVYDDLSLNFCLDDGEWLVGSETEGESTRILPSPQSPSEAPTRQQIANTNETAVLPTASAPAPASRSRYFPAALGLAAVLLIAAAGYGYFRWYSSQAVTPEIAPLPSVRSDRLTGDGRVRELAISPDGKFLALLRIENEEQSLWVKQIETNSTVEILKAGMFKTILSLLFSPDGNFIYFAAVTDDIRPSVYKVPTLGGAPVRSILEAYGFAISPDGARIAYTRFDPKELESSIFVSGTDGTNDRKLAARKGKLYFDDSLAWSPDGSSIVAVTGDDDRIPNPELSISVISVKDGSVTELGKNVWDAIGPKGLVWGPSGDYIYMMAAESGRGSKQLWEVSYPEGKARKLTQNPSSYLGISITADGQSIVTLERVVRSGIWVSADTDPNNAVEVFPPRGDTWGLRWTPDGKIVYVSDQSGAEEVWIMNPDGTDQRQITNDRVYKAFPVVSVDGKTVFYRAAIYGNTIYSVPLEGGDPVVLPTRNTNGANSPDVSADGKWMVFSAWIEGQARLFRMPVSGGEPEMLTEYVATDPRYSPDGSTIACFVEDDSEGLSPRTPRIAIIPADGGAPIRTLEVPVTVSTDRAPVWMPDGKTITYINLVGETFDLWKIPIDGGPAVQLTDFDTPSLARREYSKDGKRIAIVRGETNSNAIRLTDFR